jgi:hypothetical protein
MPAQAGIQSSLSALCDINLRILDRPPEFMPGLAKRDPGADDDTEI